MTTSSIGCRECPVWFIDRAIACAVIVVFALAIAPDIRADPIRFEMQVVDGPGKGFNDPALGQQRRQAFQFAASRWGGFFQSSFPGETINLQVSFAPISPGSGERVGDAGWHVAPTLVEGVAVDAPLSCEELFGPVAVLHRVRDFDEAVAVVDDSPYGLTAAIHTRSVHRAMLFAERVAAGVVVVNAGTHGSEPHMGFGGVKQSGTGWKEAGLESLDVYSETQYVNLVVDPGLT